MATDSSLLRIAQLCIYATQFVRTHPTHITARSYSIFAPVLGSILERPADEGTTR